MEAEYQLKATRDRALAQETHAKKTYQEMTDKYNKEIEHVRFGFVIKNFIPMKACYSVLVSVQK